MPVDACAAQMLLGALGQFWAEFLNSAVHRRAVNSNPALGQKIDDILIGQRVSRIPPGGTENDITWESMVFERASALHAQPQNLNLAQASRLMQQSRPKSEAPGFCSGARDFRCDENGVLIFDGVNAFLYGFP
ncbi:hypothetical protein ACG74X_19465 [Marivita sp. S0852]|uniref:hypothetical protein n=1 Tax=Marivita sp. S0852 TaxID=3373893 RepID=UPI003981CC25